MQVQVCMMILTDTTLPVRRDDFLWPVFISNSFSVLQHGFEALFDIIFHCSTSYISITNQCEWTNYLISGRWQTDGSIPQELVDSVTASWRFLLYFVITRECLLFLTLTLK